MAGQIILGIDPGSRCVGYGVVAASPPQAQHIDNGLIVPPDGPLEDRLAYIYAELQRLIQAHGPHVGVIEDVFMAKNSRSALVLGHARGVVLLAFRQAQIPVHTYSAREIKLAVAGTGAGDKEQMQRMTRRLLRLPEIAAEDAADALAAALCYAHSFRLEQNLHKKVARGVGSA